MSPTQLRILHHCLRQGLGALFVLSGIAKLLDVPTFAEHVGSYGIVLDTWVVPTAWSICFLEIVIGAALAANLRGSLTSIVVLLCIFVAVLAYGLWLGLDIDCGCFGSGYQVSLNKQLAIDAGLFVWCGLVHASRVASRTEALRVTELIRHLIPRREHSDDSL